MTTAAVVVRWRGGEEVGRCLYSLLEHGGESLDEIVLVDSGSGDGGAETLAADFPQITVIALAENHSFAYAANHGAGASRSGFILLLNPDTEIDSQTLAPMHDFLKRHPQVIGCVPLLVGADGTSQHRWQLRHLPSRVDLVLGRPGRARFAIPPTSPAPIDQPAAAAWLIRRSGWDALGGLDPGFAPAWWEDVDLCARLHSALGEPGFPASQGFWVVPRSRVLHHGGSTLAHLNSAEFVSIYHRNLLRYARRHWSRQAGIIRTGLRLGLVARATLRPGRRQAYIAARRCL